MFGVARRREPASTTLTLIALSNRPLNFRFSLAVRSVHSGSRFFPKTRSQLSAYRRVEPKKRATLGYLMKIPAMIITPRAFRFIGSPNLGLGLEVGAMVGATLRLYPPRSYPHPAAITAAERLIAGPAVTLGIATTDARVPAVIPRRRHQWHPAAQRKYQKWATQLPTRTTASTANRSAIRHLEPVIFLIRSSESSISRCRSLG